MTINQGDLYWLKAHGEDDIAHPHVVIQDDIFNHSRITTVIVCALTTNLKRVSYPATILLDVGEGNLPKQSVIEVSKISSVEKTQLGDYIGTLSAERVAQILDGLRFLQTAFMPR